MKKLIIIGNGFDKAHNLKTTYNEFIEDFFNGYFNDRKKYPNIFAGPLYGIDNYNALKTSIAKSHQLYFENKFIEFTCPSFSVS